MMSPRPEWPKEKWSFPSQFFLLPILIRSTKFLLFTVLKLRVILILPYTSSSIASQLLTLLIFSFLKYLSCSPSIPILVRVPQVFSEYGGSSLTSLPAPSLCVPFTLCIGTSVSFQKQSSFHIISLLKVLDNVSTVYGMRPKFVSMVFQNLQVRHLCRHSCWPATASSLSHIYPSRLGLKITFVTNVFLTLLIRKSQSFLCIPTVLVWEYLFHAVLFSDLPKCPSSCQDNRLHISTAQAVCTSVSLRASIVDPGGRPLKRLKGKLTLTFAPVWL